jgi:hypothetical protein
MKTSWTKHLKDPAEKALFEQQVIAAKTVLERLAEIIQFRREHIEFSSDFETPAWSEKHAHNLGRAHSYKEILDLLTIGENQS